MVVEAFGRQAGPLYPDFLGGGPDRVMNYLGVWCPPGYPQPSCHPERMSRAFAANGVKDLVDRGPSRITELTGFVDRDPLKVQPILRRSFTTPRKTRGSVQDDNSA